METDELRREYDSDGLRESDAAENPFDQFELWFQQAVDAKIDLPDAMTLATVSKHGIPSARIVLLRGFDERGLVFFYRLPEPKRTGTGEKRTCRFGFLLARVRSANPSFGIGKHSFARGIGKILSKPPSR